MEAFLFCVEFGGRTAALVGTSEVDSYLRVKFTRVYDSGSLAPASELYSWT